MKIIKIHNNQNILNEEYGICQGFSSNGFNNKGFSYQIMPLQFNLCQKGNDPVPKLKNKAFKHFVGDIVKGISPYDDKMHKGYVKYIYYKTGEKFPYYVYIQDMENQTIIPLDAKTVKKVVNHIIGQNIHIDYLLNHGNEIDRDFQNFSPISPLAESKKEKFDFNKAVYNK